VRVTVYIGPATVQIEAPQGDEGKRLAWRLRLAMVSAGAVSQIISQAPAIPERLYAAPAAGLTTEQLAERVRAWLVRAGHEVEG